MARFTQFIGLSPAASKFLNEHEHKVIGSWKMTTGIANEDVMGNIYEVVDGTDQFECPCPHTYVEVEQCSPWSSGPMIHTCLLALPSGEKCYEWKDDEIHYD
jgi:hypothetical protein